MDSDKQNNFGSKAVGASFNPAKSSDVDDIKQSAATFINTVCGENGEKLQGPDNDGEVIAMRKLSLRAAQEAQMWAVKAATWNK